MSAMLALAMVMAGMTMPASEPISVVSARAQIHALNGRIVRVRGWLSRCHRLSCGLHPDLAAARAQDTDGAYLSLAGGTVLDERAPELSLSEVVLEGVLSDRCRQPPAATEVVVCTDRAPDFTPTHVIAVLGQAPKGSE